MPTLVLILLFALILVGAWYLDIRSWHRKSRDELLYLLQSTDWRYHSTVLKELKRRGEDINVYIPQILARLVADSKIARCAAFLTLKDCFPDLAAEIKGFSGTADRNVCRAHVTGLLSRYRVAA
jgi:hypothetical protein